MLFKLSEENMKNLNAVLENVSEKIDVHNEKFIFSMAGGCPCGGTCAGECTSCKGGCSGHFTIG